MLTHYEVLNQLLANACPAQLDVDGVDGVNLYHVELHCAQFAIKASLKSTWNEIQYDIHSIEAVQFEDWN